MSFSFYWKIGLIVIKHFIVASVTLVIIYQSYADET